MNILVLGGSYFLGKRFVYMVKDKYSITLINRGNKHLPLNQITQIAGDRRSTVPYELLKQKENHFDAVIDFCGYRSGDIEYVFEQLKAGFNQYVFVSTVDVYERGLGKLLDEDAPFEHRNFGGEAGEYIAGKVALEQELVDCSDKSGVKYTVIRPAFIYGAQNYAPREGLYFNWINKATQILHPQDATGEFQMVYVDDVAKAIVNAIGNENAYNQAYNLSPNPALTYDAFAKILKNATGVDFEVVNINVETVIEKNIPLPFPLTKEESNWYDGRKALTLIDKYVPIEKGMAETFKAFKGEM